MNTIEMMLEALRECTVMPSCSTKVFAAIEVGEQKLKREPDAEFDHAVISWKANEELDRATIDRLTAERDALQHEIYLTWLVLKDAGVHPGRTDNTLKEVVGWLKDENAALRADAERLDWIECRAMNANIEIARSIMRTGYEFDIHAPEGTTVWVKYGTLRRAIDAVISGEKT